MNILPIHPVLLLIQSFDDDVSITHARLSLGTEVRKETYELPKPD